LRMKKPGIEAKTVFREPAEALAEFGVEQQAWRKILGRALDRRVWVPHRSAANSPEAAGRRAQMGLKNRIDAFAELKVGITDDPRAHPCGTIAAARADRRDAVDEFGFPDRGEIGISIGAVHRIALHEDRRADVVA